MVTRKAVPAGATPILGVPPGATLGALTTNFDGVRRSSSSSKHRIARRPPMTGRPCEFFALVTLAEYFFRRWNQARSMTVLRETSQGGISLRLSGLSQGAVCCEGQTFLSAEV